MIEVTFTDQGEHYTTEDGEAIVHFAKPKQTGAWGRYIEEATTILDKISEDTNPRGVSILIGAMCYLVDQGYYGIHNRPIDIEHKKKG